MKSCFSHIKFKNRIYTFTFAECIKIELLNVDDYDLLNGVGHDSRR